MSNNIKLNKGLCIPLLGEAQKKVVSEVKPDTVAVKPTDFRSLVPHLLVREGDAVKAGSPLFADKMFPEILFTSPVAGTVKSVVRGDKRKLLAVIVKAEGEGSEDFGKRDVASTSAEDLRATLLRSGLWASIVSRPYGITANPASHPKAVFISAFSTAPCAPDTDFLLEGEEQNLQTGIDVLAKVSGAPVHVSFRDSVSGPLAGAKGITAHVFEGGKHPVGNVGVQIHNISPILKGENVWTISPVHIAAIGRLFNTGKLDLGVRVAVTGAAAKSCAYVQTVAGAPVAALAEATSDKARYVSGDLLSGENVGKDGHLGFFSNQISLVEEGDYFEMFGWMKPCRGKLFSASRAYLSALCGKKSYALDTNVHGGVRAFMFNTLYSDVLPMHIFPVYLCKACIAGDIDKMEKFGIYEVLPEDLATCEFVCPSKIEWQSIISDGIQLMLKEMA